MENMSHSSLKCSFHLSSIVATSCHHIIKYAKSQVLDSFPPSFWSSVARGEVGTPTAHPAGGRDADSEKLFALCPKDRDAPMVFVGENVPSCRHLDQAERVEKSLPRIVFCFLSKLLFQAQFGYFLCHFLLVQKVTKKTALLIF